MPLSGRVAFVTGASQGIGRACALKLSAEGAAVAVAARNQEKLNALVNEITAMGGKAAAYALDVTDEEQVKSSIKSVDSAVRQDRHPGQQCRHHSRSARHAYETGRLGCRAANQPHVGLSLYASRQQFHAQAALGTHH